MFKLKCIGKINVKIFSVFVTPQIYNGHIEVFPITFILIAIIKINPTFNGYKLKAIINDLLAAKTNNS